MASVYDLWFKWAYPRREDAEIHIGIYSTEAAAKAAVAELVEKRGFREHPSGFDIRKIELDRTGWQDGFVTEYGPPPKDATAEASDLPARG
jgi:hypothetical protein